MNDIRLREVVDADLLLLFEHQFDEAANRQAAFTAKDPTDRAAFFANARREEIIEVFLKLEAGDEDAAAGAPRESSP